METVEKDDDKEIRTYAPGKTKTRKKEAHFLRIILRRDQSGDYNDENTGKFKHM